MQWSRSVERLEALRRTRGAGPWSRAALVGAGWSTRQIERDVDAGRLERVSRGLYAIAGASIAWDNPTSYIGFLERAGPGAAVSHESAARLHRSWLPYPVDDRVHLTGDGRPRTDAPALRVHRSSLDASDVVLIGGVRVTSLQRTAVDLARGTTFAQGLVALDSAVRILALGEAARSAAGRTLLAGPGGKARTAEAVARLTVQADRMAAWPGMRTVGRCLPFVDPRSESPYESWSRGELITAGLAPEEVGFEVRGASGRLYVADLAWPSRGVLAEVDGLRKYGDDARTVRERLAAERHRQGDLEDAGWRVVRWTAGERAAILVARTGRALAATAA